MKRRPTAKSAGSADVMPVELRRPSSVFDDGPGEHRGVRIYRRWREAQAAWTTEHGWTRREVAGFNHPEWIGYGWGDEPPMTREAMDDA